MSYFGTITTYAPTKNGGRRIIESNVFECVSTQIETVRRVLKGKTKTTPNTVGKIYAQGSSKVLESYENGIIQA